MLKVTYEQLIQDPLKVAQKVSGFLGVNAPEDVPPQPFTKQSSGDPRRALDSDSWEALYATFKHTERAADFTVSAPPALFMDEEDETMNGVHSAENAASVLDPFLWDVSSNIEQQKFALTGGGMLSSQMLKGESLWDTRSRL